MIEIITFHKSVNYGALLQSLSLKEFIENQFKTKVYMCEYHPKKLLFAEYYRPMMTKKIDKLFQTIQKNYKIQRWKKKAFGKDVLINRNKIKLNIYGSDEIWNFSNAYHGYDPFYFGQNNNLNKIAYAVSIGRSNADLTDLNLKNDISIYLEKFNKISVRDQNTFLFVKKLTNLEPEIVLDPTLVYTPKILNDQNYISLKIKEEYAIVYGTVFSANQQKLINEFCKKRNLKIISAGYYNRWIKNNYLGLNPTNFIDVLKNSSYVFTSMFHGAVFSVKFSKQFYFSLDPIRKNKIESFINNLNLNDRIILDEINENYIDYKELNKTLNLLILKSQKFLGDNIRQFYK